LIDNYEAALLENLRTTIQYVKENIGNKAIMSVLFFMCTNAKNVEIDAIKHWCNPLRPTNTESSMPLRSLNIICSKSMIRVSRKDIQAAQQKNIKGKAYHLEAVLSIENRQVTSINRPSDLKTAEQDT